MTTTTTITTETTKMRATAVMKAIQFHGKEDIRCNEIATPEPGPGQVRIRPAFVGICGTGLYLLLSKPPLPLVTSTANEESL